MAAFKEDGTALDPGIRDVVKLLREHGYATTDSGDGVSKPEGWHESGEAMPYPHVACTTESATLRADSERLVELLRENGFDGWEVEGSFSTRDKTSVLFAWKPPR